MTRIKIDIGAINRIRAAQKKRATPIQHLTFFGSLVNAAGRSVSYTFTALCGVAPPTPTAGWAKWSIIDRPQQVGMTVHTGYDPVSMDVQVRFDCVTDDYEDRALRGTPNRSAQQLEDDIQKLIWMSGRGRLFSQDGGVGVAALGDSPIVRVLSADPSGAESSLVPSDFQGVKWVVTNLDFDSSTAGCFRNKSGFRVRQDVTVTLLQFVEDQYAIGADSSAARARARIGLSSQYKVVVTTSAMNTVLKVATAMAKDPAAAPAILLANKDVASLGTSTRKALPIGTRLKVPLSVIKVGSS